MIRHISYIFLSAARWFLKDHIRVYCSRFVVRIQILEYHHIACRVCVSCYTSRLCVTFLHYSHDRSNCSSPSFSSTRFQNSPDISDLLSEVPHPQLHTKLYSESSTISVSSLNLSAVCWWKKSSVCWMLLLPWQSWIYLHVNVKQHLLSCYTKYLKYSTFSVCFWSTIICIADGCLYILITVDFPTFISIPQHLPVSFRP